MAGYLQAVEETVKEAKDLYDAGAKIYHKFVDDSPPVAVAAATGGATMSIAPARERWGGLARAKRHSVLRHKPKKGDNAVVVTSRDYIGPLTTGTGDIGEVMMSFYLAPASAPQGRQAIQATSWEQYIPVETTLEFVSAAGTQTSGLLHFIPDTDPANLVAAGGVVSVGRESSEQGAKTGSVWKPMLIRCPIPSDTGSKYTDSSTSNDADLRLTTYGKFTVVRGEGCADSTTYGGLWIRTKILYHVPASEPNAGNALTEGYVPTGTSLATLLASSLTTMWSTGSTILTRGNTSITFRRPATETYVHFSLLLIGTSLTSGGSPGWTFVGGSGTSVANFAMISAAATNGQFEGIALIEPGVEATYSIATATGTVSSAVLTLTSVSMSNGAKLTYLRKQPSALPAYWADQLEHKAKAAAAITKLAEARGSRAPEGITGVAVAQPPAQKPAQNQPQNQQQAAAPVQDEEPVKMLPEVPDGYVLVRKNGGQR